MLADASIHFKHCTKVSSMDSGIRQNDENIFKEARHSRVLLSGIFLNWAGTQIDPRQKHSGMTLLLVNDAHPPTFT